MLNIHWFVGDKEKFLPKCRLDHLPRVGDEVRSGPNTFFRVEKIVWCLDENYSMGQRVNVQLEKLKV